MLLVDHTSTESRKERDDYNEDLRPHCLLSTDPGREASSSEMSFAARPRPFAFDDCESMKAMSVWVEERDGVSFERRRGEQTRRGRTRGVTNRGTAQN